MDEKARCDIIIPVFNRQDLTGNCLMSIRKNTPSLSYNLILIDNGSGESVKKFLKDFVSTNVNAALIENRENLGWVKAVNQGIRVSSAPYICVMNNDTVVRTPEWLLKMITVAESAPDIGLVNPYFESGNYMTAGISFIEIDFCRGYCVLIKRKVVERIGLLDESYGLGYYDDDDYSVRAIKAGFRCVRANDCLVEHLRDSTFSDLFEEKKRLEMHEKNKRLFYSKWGRRLRLVFTATKSVDKKKLSDVLLSVARRQHIVHLWNSGEKVDFNHINIRQCFLPAFLCRVVIPAALYLNKAKRRSKHYDLVFIDDAGLNLVLSRLGYNVYYVDMEKDGSRINEIIESAARWQE